jgi:L-malate glycosyltransferase
LKVLILAAWFPSKESPVSGIFIAEQARALARVHDVRVLVPRVLNRGEQRTRSVETQEGYTLVRLGLPPRNLVHQVEYSVAVAREAKQHGSQVIHAHVTLPAGFSAVVAGKFTGIPVVITEHRGPFSALLGNPRDRMKVGYALKHASAVIAVSSALAREMANQARVERRILVIPNLVDTAKFRPAGDIETRQSMPSMPSMESSPGFRLLFTGRIDDDNKNLSGLLRSMKILSNGGGTKYRLRVIGDGLTRQESEAFARHLGIESSCEFLGTLTPEEIAGELSRCDLFVLPSRAETFGVVAAEAMMVGRPVVATRCGGPEDFVTDETGVLVPVDDDQALADAIRKVCGNLSRYSPTRISAFAAERFGFDAVVSQLTDVYQKVTTQGKKALE